MFYFSLFLPTSSTSQDENGWRLWFDEFFTIWKALSNGIGQNIEWNLFVLFSNLAWQSIGQIDWTDHVEFLFSKFMFRLDLSSCFGEASTEYHSRINPTGIAMWIVANLGGKDGQEIQKYTMKMFDAIQSFYHPANSDKVSEELAKFVEDLVYFLIKRLHDERHNIKKECLTPEEKRLTDQNVIDFIKKMIPLAFDMLYSGCNCANVFKTLSTISPEMIIPLLVKNLLNDNTWTNLMPLPRFQRQTSIQSPTDEKPLFRRMLSLSDYSHDNSALIRKLFGSVFWCGLGDGLPIQWPFLLIFFVNLKSFFSKPCSKFNFTQENTKNASRFTFLSNSLHFIPRRFAFHCWLHDFGRARPSY